jgi:hypothetical protein
MSFTGFLVSFMMRTDINLAIVVMVRMPPRNVSETTDDLYCYVEGISNNTLLNSTLENQQVSSKICLNLL